MGEVWSCPWTGTNDTLFLRRRHDPAPVLVPIILFFGGGGLILPLNWYQWYSFLRRRHDPAPVLVPIILFFGGGGLILLLDWYQWYSFLADEGWSCSCTGTYDALLWRRWDDPAPVLVAPHQLLVEAQKVAVAPDDAEAAPPETLEVCPVLAYILCWYNKCTVIWNM
jgi:hypothetical protein